MNLALMDELMKIHEPTNVEEALASPEWKESMQAEYDSIIKNQTWELVDRPHNRKVIDTKWIWRVRYKSDGTLENYNSRLVVQGFSQVEGFDFQETFTPTTKITTIHAIIALATTRRWKIIQMGVELAYLNGYLEEEIYVFQPLGFEVQVQKTRYVD